MKVEQLERELGEWLHTPSENIVGCASGTAALHLALESLCLPLGSEVIVPDYTMVACARAVTLAGLVPVFVDCREDLLLDVSLLQKNLRVSERAVMPVHIYGRRCSMGNISNLANWCHLAVIEDMAEAHGIPIHPESYAACYSLYKNKIVHGEEGGAVCFRKDYHAFLSRRLRSLGFTSEHNFEHVPRGHNYRLSDTHASLIIDSLRGVHHNLQLRRGIEQIYDSLCPSKWKMPSRDVVWVYDLRIPGMTSLVQDRIVRCLREVGIEARHGFKPMHSQVEYKHCRRIGGDVAERMSREVIYLPVVPGFTTERSIIQAFSVIHKVLD